MPELPEVETVVRSLIPHITGLKVSGAELRFEKTLRRPVAYSFSELAGRRILGIRRRGKMIVIALEGGPALVFHLKMTGQLMVVPPAEPRDKHVHFILSFVAGDRELRFRDVRKFGFVRCLEAGCVAEAPEMAELGPEPLDIGRREFAALFAGRRGRMKSLLLDQRRIAGIGNIYADEILFAAGVHPRTSAARLKSEDFDRVWTEMRRILKRAIAAKGTSISDYRDADGNEGGFQIRLKVYGLAGEPCPRCKTPIRRLVVGGRGTHICPKCQRERRAR